MGGGGDSLNLLGQEMTIAKSINSITCVLFCFEVFVRIYLGPTDDMARKQDLKCSLNSIAIKKV